MEEWVFLGESGSDAETVCSVDDKGSETDFAMVQLRRSRAAESRATMAEGGKNHDEEESDHDDDDDHYFDLNLPALAGSKAVFGANGDCFVAASILSMGSVGYDSGFHGADAEDDIDTVSLGAPDGDGDGTVHPERVLCAHCAKIDTDQSSHAARLVKYDDIDTGSSDDELSDEDQSSDMAGLVKYDDLDTGSSEGEPSDEDDTDQSSDMSELVKYDDIDIDTGSSDSSESDYGDDDELSDEDDTDGSVWAELVNNYDDIDTGSSDSSESDHDGNDDLSDEDDTDGNIAPQQRRLTAIATRRPPSAPHLFFTQRSRSTHKSTDAEEGDDENTMNPSDAAEDDDNYETESYSAVDHTKTSYTSLAHRDEVISGFVGAMMTRADALARFDAVESALELPQYNLSGSDVLAWKAALGKGRAGIAARLRPPVAPHLFFTQPSRST